MKFSAQQIAEVLKGKVDGDPEAEVSTLSKIEEGRPGSISFLANKAYTQYIYETEASIVVVNEDFIPEKAVKPTMIRVKNAYSAFTMLLEMYQQAKAVQPKVSDKASVATTAQIGKNVFIGDFVAIGENTVIGDNCRIYANTSIGNNCNIGSESTFFAGVKIYDESVIGNRCTFHAGVVVGSDGFGFAPQEDKSYKKIPQIGNVVVEDDVEIGANTTIDCATMGSTLIKKGVKLDNLIQIAHNVEIGENTVVAAQTGISGSTKIGKNCIIAGQVGIIGHLKIPDNTTITAQSGVTKSFKNPGMIIGGSPAFNHSDFQKSSVHFKRLNELVNRINELERKLKNQNITE
ncbi:MAG: UDP-3-O-(3-hydroxymyristoyl)glucosamine N-acyltransferase [Bacteroidales bacterium]|nr:UDP-3-O-(3-hydroxymyristoyl)glucosamine N-acyltransferase [Bacteroidales bacterium]